MLSTKELTKIIDQKEDVHIKLMALHEEFQKANHHELASKVKQLILKVDANEFVIGFCGHFSAGKSTMINELVGQKILPSSPIPTSANIVKVKKGQNYCRVFYKEDQPVEYKAPYDLEQIKQYCKDGGTVHSLELSSDHISIPDDLVIMDTPGIDSTDDAHRLATESALHLADMVFYVMDYNHVLSEQNFVFTKTLKDQNKKVYLIVNQIDKHIETELPFSEYKQTVLSAFRDWGVQVDGVFYTTLKNQNHPFNEWSNVKKLINKQINSRSETQNISLSSSMLQLIEEDIKQTHEEYEEQIQQAQDLLSDVNRDEIDKQVYNLRSQIADIKNETEVFEKMMRERVHNVLNNAYLMPFETRELAKSYLEACQSDFKVGFLFSKKKTEEEKHERLQSFFDDFNKKVEANIAWHIQQSLVELLKEYNILDEDIMQQAQKLHVPISTALLSDQVKTTSGFTGETVLNYTNDVAKAVKRLYEKATTTIIEAGKEVLSIKNKHVITKAEQDLHLWETYEKAKNKLDEIDNALSRRREELYKALIRNEYSEDLYKRLDDLLKQQIKFREETMAEIKSVNREKLRSKDTPADGVDQSSEEKVTRTIADLKESYHILNDIKGAEALAKRLKEKASSLEHQQFSVALFGAFSAGKSSFANALLGEGLLPVSPNPTTATINKIVPPNEENPHGTVVVKLKDEDQLHMDLAKSTQLFTNKESKSIREALAITKSIKMDNDYQPNQKLHYSFLKAVQTGLPSYRDDLGKEIKVSLEEFASFVKDEEKACLVEWIEVFYSCPLTKQGITLVDTPGADSINARHTGVAFEYIKNADAILFVTYYNHAFSKADREFLIQLGRVKEAFELDKMFFIVNAADLAESKDELNHVMDYIEDQLVAYGIRQPRMYPISSHYALAEKQNQDLGPIPSMQDSGLKGFEQDFIQFIKFGLAEMTIQSAYEQLKYGFEYMYDLIQTSKEDQSVKQQKLLQWKENEKTIQTAIEQYRADVEKQEITQEIEELVYYVKQRVFLRYSDAFKEHFSSSALRTDGGRSIKSALHSCLEELIEFIGFDLAQELRATALRVENAVMHSSKEVIKNLSLKAETVQNGIHFPMDVTQSFTSLAFNPAFDRKDAQQFESVLSLFKNSKIFFEQNGKEQMKNRLREIVDSPVQSYLDQNKGRIEDYYIEVFNMELVKLKENLLTETETYFAGLYSILEEDYDLEKLESNYERLKGLVESGLEN